MIRKSRYLAKYGIVPLLVLCAFVFISSDSVKAETFSWSGAISGEDPSFTAEGTADFTIEDIGGVDHLQLVLTYTTGDELTTIGQTLTALTWDITGDSASITLTGVSAIMEDGTDLFFSDGSSITKASFGGDLSGEWGWSDDYSGEITEAGATLGDYTVSSVGLGDIFGPDDRFTDTNQYGIVNLNGSGGSIISGSTDLTSGGFQSVNNEPWVASSMVFLFEINSVLDLGDIDNVVALFGTDGAPIPEPTTMLLLGSGLVGLALCARRRSRKETDKVS